MDKTPLNPSSAKQKQILSIENSFEALQFLLAFSESLKKHFQLQKLKTRKRYSSQTASPGGGIITLTTALVRSGKGDEKLQGLQA